MKVFAIIALLVAGVCAEPVRVVQSPTGIPARSPVQKNLIIEIIQSVLNSVFELVQEYDPLTVDSWEVGTEVLGLVPVGASIHGLSFNGFGNININALSFTGNQIAFDIEIPRIGLSAALARVYLAGAEASIGGSGGLNNLRLQILATVNLSDGLEFDELDIELSFASIDAQTTVFVLGTDYSDLVDNYLNVLIPGWIQANAARINQIINIIVKAILEAV